MLSIQGKIVLRLIRNEQSAIRKQPTWPRSRLTGVKHAFLLADAPNELRRFRGHSRNPKRALGTLALGLIRLLSDPDLSVGEPYIRMSIAEVRVARGRARAPGDDAFPLRVRTLTTTLSQV